MLQFVILTLLFASATPVFADSILYSDPSKGLDLEFGALDPADSDPLLGTSPYFGVRKYGSRSGKWFDWEYDSKLFILDLNARYGTDVPSESQTLFIGSALGRIGRAYSLFGPIDVGWSVMGVMRAVDMFPNLSIDETVGVRWKFNNRHSMGFFTGLTQSAIEGGRTWTEKLKEERTAKHDAFAFWGRTRENLGYRVKFGRQQNATTDIETLTSSLVIPRQGDPLSLRLRVEEEKGDLIEFQRKRTSIGSDFRIAKSWDMGIDLGVDDISFGGVETKARSLMLTFRYNPRKSKRNLRFTTTGTHRNDSAPAAGELPIARKVYDAVVRLDAVLVVIQEGLASVDPVHAAQALADAIADLPPIVAEALAEELDGLDADKIAALVEQAQNDTAAARDELARIGAIVGDPALIERLAVRTARKELYAEISSEEVHILGKSVPLTPVQLIALSHAYGLSNDPVPPVTSRDIDNWINEECSGPLRNCLLSRLPSALRPAAEEAWNNSSTLEDSVRWATDLAKREINRLLLNVMLAAERLDALAVGGGRRPGELNNAAVQGSFNALDQRRAGRLTPVFRNARSRI